MNILITGCAGLIGSNLCQWILDKFPGVNIIGIDNLSGGYESHIPEKVIFYNLDLSDFDKVELSNLQRQILYGTKDIIRWCEFLCINSWELRESHTDFGCIYSTAVNEAKTCYLFG